MKNKKTILVLILALPLLLFSNDFCENDTESFKKHDPQKDRLEKIYNISYFEKNLPEVDYSVSGSVILWQPIEGGLELGIFRPSDQNSDWPSINMDFDYRPGFKVALGCHFKNSYLEAFLEYTFFHMQSSKESRQKGAMQSIITPWYNETEIPSLVLKAKWRLKYDILDFKLLRKSYTGKKLVLSPLFGVRGGFLRQKYDLFTTLDYGKINSFNNVRSFLVGPKTGVETNWILNHGVDILVNFSGSLLFQNFTTKRQVDNFSDPQSLDINIKTKSKNFNPNLEVLFAINYQNFNETKNSYLNFLAGYEFQYFFNQNIFQNVQAIENRADDNPNDLMMHGLTIKFRYDY
ncbi:MAG: hypothetical protein JXA94_06030 [Parachlamydiales bacterium]|nr:hypothetical protein [Parachlamydiales bacterium]